MKLFRLSITNILLRKLLITANFPGCFIPNHSMHGEAGIKTMDGLHIVELFSEVGVSAGVAAKAKYKHNDMKKINY